MGDRGYTAPTPCTMRLTNFELDVLRYGAGPFIAALALLTSWRANKRSRENEEWRRVQDREQDARRLLVGIALVPLSTTPSTRRPAIYDDLSTRVQITDQVRQSVPQGWDIRRWPVAHIHNHMSYTALGLRIRWYGRGVLQRAVSVVPPVLPGGTAWVPYEPVDYFAGSFSYLRDEWRMRVVLEFGDISNVTWNRLSVRQVAGPGFLTSDRSILRCWLADGHAGDTSQQYASHVSRRRKRMARLLPDRRSRFELLLYRLVKSCNSGLHRGSAETRKPVRALVCDGNSDIHWTCERCYDSLVKSNDIYGIFAERNEQGRLLHYRPLRKVLIR
jgi:hypothetical protein